MDVKAWASMTARREKTWLDACSIWKQKLRNHKKKHVEGHYLNAKTFIYFSFIPVEMYLNEWKHSGFWLYFWVINKY